jgi:hypothetical protein
VSKSTTRNNYALFFADLRADAIERRLFSALASASRAAKIHSTPSPR